MNIDDQLKAEDLTGNLDALWSLSAEKIRLVEKDYDINSGSPVFTVEGRYSTRGWTEWTQGFQVGSSILQFDATGDEEFLQLGKKQTVEWMAPHVSHTGVHDHGFNNVSTYGNLLRLLKEGKIPADESEKNFYELALKVSGAVQASRWTTIAGGGFIHSLVVYKKRMLFGIFSCTNSVRQFILSAWLLKLLIVGTVEVKISLNLARRPTINSATAAMIVVNKAAKTPQ